MQGRLRPKSKAGRRSSKFPKPRNFLVLLGLTVLAWNMVENSVLMILACSLACGRRWIICSIRLRFPDLKGGSKKASTSFATVATLIGITNQKARSTYSPVFNLLDPLGSWLNQVPACLTRSRTGDEANDLLLLACPNEDICRVAIPVLLL